MKKSIRSLVVCAALGAFALAANAEPAVKILVVDMAKLFESHYKTQEQLGKLQADKQKAEEELERMNKDLNTLIEEYKNLQEQSSNVALTAEAKAKNQTDAQKKMDEIQAKQNEGRSFIQNSSQSLNQRLQTFRSLLFEEISKVATDVAKRRGATLVIDKALPSAAGISNIIYADPGFDITDDVLKEINKDRPATAPAAPAASAPASTSSAPSTSGPTINLPIAPKK